METFLSQATGLVMFVAKTALMSPTAWLNCRQFPTAPHPGQSTHPPFFSEHLIEGSCHCKLFLWPSKWKSSWSLFTVLQPKHVFLKNLGHPSEM